VVTLKKSTYSARETDKSGKWWIVDADGAVLGRLASVVASRLKGKHNPMYTPHMDSGDFIVVVNAEKIVLTGNKDKNKIYYRHSGYIGGLKSISAGKLIDQNPEEVIRYAVKGMLPKNTLGRAMFKKLKVYSGSDHPHEAQQPKPLDVKSIY
jgi:large subunit ribosomal protein L13